MRVIQSPENDFPVQMPEEKDSDVLSRIVDEIRRAQKILTVATVLIAKRLCYLEETGLWKLSGEDDFISFCKVHFQMGRSKVYEYLKIGKEVFPLAEQKGFEDVLYEVPAYRWKELLPALGKVKTPEEKELLIRRAAVETLRGWKDTIREIKGKPTSLDCECRDIEVTVPDVPQIFSVWVECKRCGSWKKLS